MLQFHCNSSVGTWNSLESMGKFDPFLIVSQIIAIQCFCYVALGILFLVSHLIFGLTISLDLYFLSKHYNGDSSFTFIIVFDQILAGLIGYG